jgi:ABC-2 type transport system permease protein
MSGSLNDSTPSSTSSGTHSSTQDSVRRRIPSVKKKQFLRPPVGTVWWLLLHEIRLFFYDMGDQRKSGEGKRGMPTSGKIALAFVVIVIHVGVWGMMKALPPFTAVPPPKVLMIVGIVMAVVFSLMVSLALNRSVKALFERGDLDLLLSSPISSRTIFNVRLAGIILGVAFISLFLLSPIAHIGLLLGQVRWLGIYPTIFSLSMIAASIGMLATLGLVRAIGVRRSLVAAQLLSALTGAVMFILSQLFGNAGASFKQQILANITPMFAPGALLGPDSWAWIPAKALFGAPLELLVFSGLGIGFFWITANFTHQFFVRGVQQSGAMNHRSPVLLNQDTGQAAVKVSAKKFTQGAMRNIVFKEWRLIKRDPQLISHIFLQILYLAPAFFVIFKKDSVLPGVAAAVTFFAAALAGSLIWIIISAEDAPELLRSAPIDNKSVRRAKLFAAVLPVLALISPPLVWLGLHDLRFALIMLVGSVAAMYSVSLIHLWMAKEGTRAQFNRRAQGNFGAGILEVFSNFAWAGTVYVSLLFSWWGLVPLAISLVILGMARMFKSS